MTFGPPKSGISGSTKKNWIECLNTPAKPCGADLPPSARGSSSMRCSHVSPRRSRRAGTIVRLACIGVKRDRQSGTFYRLLLYYNLPSPVSELCELLELYRFTCQAAERHGCPPICPCVSP